MPGPIHQSPSKAQQLKLLSFFCMSSSSLSASVETAATDWLDTLGRYRDLIGYKAYADLKAEAARTYINYLWWVLDPLMSLGVYYAVIGLFFQRGGPGFIFVLLTGLIFWRWYAESISHGASTIMNGKGLMTQVDMPKWVFPVVCLVTDGTKFLFTLSILLLILLALGPGAHITWLALPLVMAVQFFLLAGVSITTAALVPFVPDLRHVIGTLLMLQMFLSGVFYDTGHMLEKHLFWFFLNPMARLINEYREILLNGHWPHWGGLAYVAVLGLGFLAIGLWLVHRFDKTYPRLN